MIRDLVLTLTMLAIVFILANQPRHVESVRVDYCLVGKNFAPCAGLFYSLEI